jgi:hypothetical protein
MLVSATPGITIGAAVSRTPSGLPQLVGIRLVRPGVILTFSDRFRPFPTRQLPFFGADASQIQCSRLPSRARGQEVIAMHDKRKALGTIIDKLGKLLAHLGNENDGEALGAVRAMTALLKKAELDWHDLVALLHGNQPSFLEMLRRLAEKEADVLVRLGRAAQNFFIPTKT